MTRAWLAIVLAACGAPHSEAEPHACARATGEAGQAWSALAERLEPGDATRAATPIDAALARLGAHVSEVRANPPEAIDPEVAMALSGLVMDALDALPTPLDPAARARADDAAEALLTDRTPGGSVRAARAAAAALRAALGATDPNAANAREGAAAREQLRRRAQSAADGYAEGVATGDRRAARAEALAAGADPEVEAARRAAADASRHTRETCRVSRALAVPSP